MEHFPFFQCLQREDVRLGKIFNVNVIPDARPIRRWIVATEDFDDIALPKGDLNHKRDKVSLRIMVFALTLRASRSIEISQGSVSQSLCPMRPVQNALNKILLFPVGAPRNNSLNFRNGNSFRLIKEPNTV